MMNLCYISTLFFLLILPIEAKWGWGRGRDENKHKNSVVVQTSRGRVRGYVARLPDSNPVNVFEGVPFAEPPIGKLRFKPIEPKRPWFRTWNATFYRPACLSNTTQTRSPQKNVDEDCLYVNIFADSRCNRKNLCPVIHYIHGGGFYYDSAVMFNATFIVEKYASDGIVFVIPAYRLGLFGFLDLGDDDVVDRNLGLYDIIYGIQWVRQEIKRFGGDAQKITLMGNSVGAISITYLSIAPGVQKGLWSQAVISSGMPEMTKTTNNINITRQLLELTGCLYSNHTWKGNSNLNLTRRELSKKQSVQCLRKVDALDLLDYQKQLEDEQNIAFKLITIGGPLFRGKDFTELLSYWKAVPTIIGSMKCEFDSDDTSMAETCARYPPIFNYTSNEVFEACITHYSNVTEEILPPAADPIHAEVYREARVITQRGGKAFVYSFDQANHTYHSNDATFMIGIHLPKEWTREERLMENYYPNMIKRFAKTGLPDKDWKPMDSKTGKNYFVLDFSIYEDTIFGPYLVEEPYYEEGTRFWLRDLAIVEAEAHDYNITLLEEDDRRPITLYSLPIGHLNETAIFNITDTNLEPLTDVYSEMDAFEPEEEEEDESVHEAWGPFWVTLSLCVILGTIILVMVLSRFIYRFQNTKGYYYNDSPGFFTETSKIVTMNGPRYYS